MQLAVWQYDKLGAVKAPLCYIAQTTMKVVHLAKGYSI